MEEKETDEFDLEEELLKEEQGDYQEEEIEDEQFEEEMEVLKKEEEEKEKEESAHGRIEELIPEKEEDRHQENEIIKEKQQNNDENRQRHEMKKRVMKLFQTEEQLLKETIALLKEGLVCAKELANSKNGTKDGAIQYLQNKSEDEKGDIDASKMASRDGEEGIKGKSSRWWKPLFCFGRRKKHTDGTVKEGRMG